MQSRKVMLLAGVALSTPFFKVLTIHVMIVLTGGGGERGGGGSGVGSTMHALGCVRLALQAVRH